MHCGNTHASRCPHRTAAYPHSRHDWLFLSDHVNATATNVLSLAAHSERAASGSPARTRARKVVSATAGSVACNFLYDVQSLTLRSCLWDDSEGVTRSMFSIWGSVSPNLRGWVRVSDGSGYPIYYAPKELVGEKKEEKIPSTNHLEECPDGSETRDDMCTSGVYVCDCDNGP